MSDVTPETKPRLGRTPILIWAAVAGFVLPALCDLFASGWHRRAFGWVAADAFYYLTVARNIVLHGCVAYDQENPSNGFHPLWQALCAALAEVTSRLARQETLVLAVVLVGVALIAAAIPFVGLGLAASRRRLSLLFPLLPVGAYAFLVLPVWARARPTLPAQNEFEGPMPLYGTLWSFANGMESALVLFFFALGGWLFVRGGIRTSPRRAAALGLCFAGLILSRLDHALLVLPAVGVSAFLAVSTRAWRIPLASFCAACLAPLGLYVLINHHFYGTLVPVSGAIKSTYPHVDNGNLDEVAEFWNGPWRGQFLMTASRQFLAIIPAVVALLYLGLVVRVQPVNAAATIRLRPWANRYDVFLAMMAPGVVLLAAYNILFVRWYAQGSWYFPASTLFVSMVVLSVAGVVEEEVQSWARGSAARLARWRRPGRGVYAVACLSCLLVVFLRFHRQPDYHRTYADFFFDEAPKVRAHYGAKMPKILEGDDGIVAYSLGTPTMSTNLALDPEGLTAFARGRLLDLALSRGFDRLTSLVYTKGDSLRGNPSSDDVTKWAQHVLPFGDPKKFDFAVDYRSSDGAFAIVRAWKK